MATDPDYEWLKAHLGFSGAIAARAALAKEVSRTLLERIQSRRLPYTLGVFGSWGTGKTTFLAQVAEQLEGAQSPPSIVYFNSWKYAGFMEIVPALIYKTLYYGTRWSGEKRKEAAMRVLLALGNQYSDQFGEWAHKNFGVDPTKLFKQVYKVAMAAKDATTLVNPDVMHAYYTQVDKAQDELAEAIGTVSGERPGDPIVVLIDELDRCDPDEAFTVVKQMRVLFGMRNLPIAFVVCANPDPIGLAIKHRYGLENDGSDYEARRILEKFVDAYQELGKGTPHRSVVDDVWSEMDLPWLIKFDEANVRPPLNDDTVLNAAAFDVMSTDSPLFANLRVLRKSFEYVLVDAGADDVLLWTKWLLEIANQLDPRFRYDVKTMTPIIQDCICESYKSLRSVSLETRKDGKRDRINFTWKDGQTKGNTLFAILRSYFWEHMDRKLEELGHSKVPQQLARGQALKLLLSEPAKVDFVVLLGMLPFEGLPNFRDLLNAGATSLPIPSDEQVEDWGAAFGSLLDTA